MPRAFVKFIVLKGALIGEIDNQRGLFITNYIESEKLLNYLNTTP